jgi:FAD/FMN-containing dehydrogenase
MIHVVPSHSDTRPGTVSPHHHRARLVYPQLIRAGQPGYQAATPWNLAVPSQPAAVAEARTAEDVSAAVRYAGQHGLRVAVRSTGHGAVPVDASTLLVHTAAMDDFTIDPTRRVARFGAGVRWQLLLDAAARFGLAPICGSAPGIGAVGYLTGGGIGPLARTYGVSSDFVREMKVVVGDGRVLRATPTEHPDLFWGLRGGKATLGLVTEVEMDLVALSDFYGGALWFDAVDAAPVLRAWRRMCADLPDQCTTSIAVMRLPQLDVLPAQIAGRQTVSVRFGWVGDQQRGESFLGRIRESASAVLDDIRRRPYRQIGAIHSDPVAPAAVTQRSALLGEISDVAVERLLDSTRPGENRQSIVELRRLGGAIARMPRHASAYCHREAAYSLFLSGPAGPDVADLDAQAGRVVDALSPWTQPGLLPNFAASDDPAEIARCYDRDSLYWLNELGDHYDPDHVLHIGQVARRARPGGS